MAEGMSCLLPCSCAGGVGGSGPSMIHSYCNCSFTSSSSAEWGRRALEVGRTIPLVYSDIVIYSGALALLQQIAPVLLVC